MKSEISIQTAKKILDHFSIGQKVLIRDNEEKVTTEGKIIHITKDSLLAQLNNYRMTISWKELLCKNISIRILKSV